MLVVRFVVVVKIVMSTREGSCTAGLLFRCCLVVEVLCLESGACQQRQLAGLPRAEQNTTPSSQGNWKSGDKTLQHW